MLSFLSFSLWKWDYRQLWTHLVICHLGHISAGFADAYGRTSHTQRKKKRKVVEFLKIAGFAVPASMMTTGIFNSWGTRPYLEFRKYAMRSLRIQVNKRTALLSWLKVLLDLERIYLKLVFAFYKVTLNNAKFIQINLNWTQLFPHLFPSFSPNVKKFLDLWYLGKRKQNRIKQNQVSILLLPFTNFVVLGKLSQHFETCLYETWYILYLDNVIEKVKWECTQQCIPGLYGH